MPERIRIRCNEEEYGRWQRIAGEHAPGEPQIVTLRALMDVYDHAPGALDAVEDDYIDPDDQFVIYPDPETAKSFRYFARHYESYGDALRELMNNARSSPEEFTTLDF